jgi:hypothetical protein
MTASAAAATQTATAATATESARQTEEAAPPPLTNFAGSWHSEATCSEPEPDARYRWTITLQQDAAGLVTGRITFHKRPGGGRVQYTVTGQATSGNTLTVQGKKDPATARGGLGGSAPDDPTFIITPGGPPDPNYAP